MAAAVAKQKIEAVQLAGQTIGAAAEEQKIEVAAEERTIAVAAEWQTTGKQRMAAVERQTIAVVEEVAGKIGPEAADMIVLEAAGKPAVVAGTTPAEKTTVAGQEAVDTQWAAAVEKPVAVDQMIAAVED